MFNPDSRGRDIVYDVEDSNFAVKESLGWLNRLYGRIARQLRGTITTSIPLEKCFHLTDRALGSIFPIRFVLFESPQSADRITLEYENEFRDDEPHEANNTDCEGRPEKVLNRKYCTIKIKHGDLNRSNCTTKEDLAHIYILPHRISARSHGVC